MIDQEMDGRFWNAARSRTREVAKPQESSFWIGARRDGFTRVAAKHFAVLAPEALEGVTLQVAQRHRVL